MRLISLLIIIISTFSLNAQDLVTDRPDQTESASIVPKFHFQLESGFVYTKENSIADVNNLHSLLRIGLLDKTELRIGFENNVHQISTDPTASVSNIIFPGIKHQIFKGAGIIPDIAIMGTFALPINYDEAADNFWSPEVRVAAQHNLLDFLSAGYNYGLFWDSDAYNTQQFYSVALGLDVIPKTGLFIEFFGEDFSEIGSAGYIDGGFTFSIINNIQLDGYLGYGLNDRSDELFYGVGVTIRVPK